MNIFRKKKKSLKIIVKIELSYVFTINMLVELKAAWNSGLSNKNR